LPSNPGSLAEQSKKPAEHRYPRAPIAAASEQNPGEKPKSLRAGFDGRN
jgi:hypothetical protein